MKSLEDCPILPACSSHSPYRCPSGECVEYGSSCPPRIQCPSSKPFSCSDGSCAESIDACPLLEPCKPGYLMCPDGSCVDHQLLCLIPAVCPSMSIRCSDGSCRSTEKLEEKRLSLFGEKPAVSICVDRKIKESLVHFEYNNL